MIHLFYLLSGIFFGLYWAKIPRILSLTFLFRIYRVIPTIWSNFVQKKGDENMKTFLIATAMVLLVIGCASKTMNVIPPPPDYSKSCKVIGDAEGSSGGLLLWAIIPLGVNGRFRDAYQDALDSSGGSHLIDVKVVDHWYYIPFFGIALSVRVNGKALACEGFQPRPKKEPPPKTE